MNTHEQNVLERIGAFRQALGSRPSRRRARDVLRGLVTGEAELDHALRQCAEAVFALTMCRPMLVAGHPGEQFGTCAAN